MSVPTSLRTGEPLVGGRSLRAEAVRSSRVEDSFSDGRIVREFSSDHGHWTSRTTEIPNSGEARIWETHGPR